MQATTFRRLAADLAPGWRVAALDQRGHGHSNHAATYTRQDHLSDLEAFLAELQAKAPIVLLGNSLGGINALQFAAKHPDMIQGLILEDIAVEINTDVGFVRTWSGSFERATRLKWQLDHECVLILKTRSAQASMAGTSPSIQKTWCAPRSH